MFWFFFQVHLVSEHIWCDDYLVRSFYLKNLQTNETRTVTQFHFLTWVDLGVPSSSKALLDFRRYSIDIKHLIKQDFNFVLLEIIIESLVRIRIMCWSGATCLPRTVVSLCCWPSKKSTSSSSSSHWNITSSSYDIAEILLTWH